MEINLDQDKSILHVKPSSALTTEDFSKISSIIDPYIQQKGVLKGLVIETQYFPGWKDIGGFIAHMKFIAEHQSKVQKIALVTHSKLADIARKLIGPFVKPQIKHFNYDQLALAKQWIEQS